MPQEHTQETLKIPTYFGFPFEVMMFICCASHATIALTGWTATVTGHAPSEDGYHMPECWKNRRPMWKLVKICTVILIILNIVFTVITFKTMISVANTTDYEKLSAGLSVYNASVLFMKVQACVIVPYVLGRIEISRRRQAKYE